MWVVVRDAEELVLVLNTSQCEAVKIAFRIDQPVECGLVLGFWDGRFVEVNVGMEKSGPFGEIRLPEGCDACLCGGLHRALLMLSEDKYVGELSSTPTSHSHHSVPHPIRKLSRYGRARIPSKTLASLDTDTEVDLLNASIFHFSYRMPVPYLPLSNYGARLALVLCSCCSRVDGHLSIIGQSSTCLCKTFLQNSRKELSFYYISPIYAPSD
jgi:hypothetical protein